MLSWGISRRGRGLCDPRGVRLCIWVDKVLLQPAATEAKALPVSSWGEGGGGMKSLEWVGTDDGNRPRLCTHRGMKIYAYMHIRYISYHIAQRRREAKCADGFEKWSRAVTQRIIVKGFRVV